MDTVLKPTTETVLSKVNNIGYMKQYFININFFRLITKHTILVST